MTNGIDAIVSEILRLVGRLEALEGLPGCAVELAMTRQSLRAQAVLLTAAAEQAGHYHESEG